MIASWNLAMYWVCIGVALLSAATTKDYTISLMKKVARANSATGHIPETTHLLSVRYTDTDIIRIRAGIDGDW